MVEEINYMTPHHHTHSDEGDLKPGQTSSTDTKQISDVAVESKSNPTGLEKQPKDKRNKEPDQSKKNKTRKSDDSDKII